MVLLHVKRGDHGFWLETSLAASVDETVETVVQTWNLLQRLSDLRLEAERWLSNDENRTPEPQAAQRLASAAEEADQGLDISKPVDAGEVAGHVQLLEAALLECAPATENNEGEASVPPLALPTSEAELFFVGRTLQRGAALGQQLRCGERSRVVVRLALRGEGTPPRESLLDDAHQRELLAWHYKKQQERAALEADDDDSYTHSAWADPCALKREFAGVADIRLR